MLKVLKKDDTTISPFITTKNWNLSNVSNTDIILAEDGNSIAVENVDYHFDYILPNDSCSLAKENQPNDLALYREGLKTVGLFYPNLDPQNLDGTYKRMVYSQIKTMFYNSYKDPTKIWGIEKIDFDNSGTKKFLSDYFRLFDIPTEIMGEKMLEGSISVTDNTLDNDYVITDDGNCNLFAGNNLFSKQQELGDFSNMFLSGSDNTCVTYFEFVPYPPILSGSISGSTTALLTWVEQSSGSSLIDGYGLQKSLDGINYLALSFTSPDVTSSIDYGPLLIGNDYYYRVYAYNNYWGSSSFSNIVVLIG